MKISFVIFSEDVADTGEVDQAVGHGDVGLDPGQGVPQQGGVHGEFVEALTRIQHRRRSPPGRGVRGRRQQEVREVGRAAVGGEVQGFVRWEEDVAGLGEGCEEELVREPVSLRHWSLSPLDTQVQRLGTICLVG